jgi:phosphate transport system permease protein
VNGSRRSQSRGWDRLFVALTALATLLILALLAVVLFTVLWRGGGWISWRLLSGTSLDDMFDVRRATLLPLIIGTVARVLLMTLFVLPVGVITAIYLTEYAPAASRITRIIRAGISNLAGVPSIVFGLFGLGFFIGFVGSGMDRVLRSGNAEPLWGQPALIWASLTLAVMTLPVMIVATEESLRAIPAGLREASLALGATRLQTILHVVLPNALPGILTGAILAISRAAGEVAPILFTGATYFMSTLPQAVTDPFMDLAYQVFILSTQSPDLDATRPLLFANILVLLALTFALNSVAILIRARMRRTHHAQGT